MNMEGEKMMITASEGSEISVYEVPLNSDKVPSKLKETLLSNSRTVYNNMGEFYEELISSDSCSKKRLRNALLDGLLGSMSSKKKKDDTKKGRDDEAGKEDEEEEEDDEDGEDVLVLEDWKDVENDEEEENEYDEEQVRQEIVSFFENIEEYLLPDNHSGKITAKYFIFLPCT